MAGSAGQPDDFDVLSVTERKDVSMILGVGRVYRAALEAAGYATWDTLNSCDPQHVADAVTQAGARGCGPVKVADWQLHARALASGLPEFRPATRWPVDGPYIAVDLEYDVTPGQRPHLADRRRGDLPGRRRPSLLVGLARHSKNETPSPGSAACCTATRTCP